MKSVSRVEKELDTDIDPIFFTRATDFAKKEGLLVVE